MVVSRRARWLCRAGLAGAVLVTAAGACRRESPPAPPRPPAPRAPLADALPPTADAHAALSTDTAAVVAVPVPPPRPPLPAGLPVGKVITVIHSANLRGEYDPHPLGGLGRRATFLASVRKSLPSPSSVATAGLIHVDAGDALLPELPALPGEPPPDRGEVERRAQLIATGLGRLRLDGFVPGEADFQLGPQRLKQLLQGAHIPVLLANLVDERGRALFPSDRLLTVAGVKVGLFGVLSLGPAGAPSLSAAKLTVTDAIAAAQAETSQLRERGAAVVIGLAHLAGGLEEARSLARALTGVDVLVLGHDPKLTEEPELAGGDAASGGTVIVAAEERGRMLGRLDLHVVGADGGFAAARRAGTPITGSWFDHEIVALDTRFVSDPAMLALLAPYVQETRRRITRKLPVGLTARAGSHGDLADSNTENWTYATNAACALCHVKQMEQFNTTAHALALVTLEGKARQRDPYCLGCHATGFDVPGGTHNLQTANQYFGPTGCESCHGPSVVHVRAQNKTGTRRKVAAAVCLGCHRPEHALEPFDYAAALKEILGPGHGG